MNIPFIAPWPKKRSHRRWLPVVNAPFQWRYTLLVTLLGGVMLGSLGWLIYQIKTVNSQLLLHHGMAEWPALQAELARSDQQFIIYVILAMGILILGLIGWGLVITHRISGPMAVLRQHFETLASGSFPDLRSLRKRDEWQACYQAFQRAVEHMRQRDAVRNASVDEALVALRAGEVDRACRLLEECRRGTAAPH